VFRGAGAGKIDRLCIPGLNYTVCVLSLAIFRVKWKVRVRPNPKDLNPA